jgi:mono/diheme cytochrome c family protein
MMEGSLQPDDPSFNHLNAYLMWLGEGKIIWAVETPGQFQVEKSIESGKKIFQEERGGKSCKSCHGAERLTGATSNFPRYIEGYDEVLILDNFLVLHASKTMDWELNFTGSEIADLSSYLTNLSKGYVISLQRAD